MKRAAALVLLVAISAGLLCVEYEMAVWLGFGFLLIAGCGLAVIVVALYRAPQGCESGDVLYVHRSARAATHIPNQRFSQLISVRL